MKLGEWIGVVGQLPPETPVVFYLPGNRALQPDEYCEGRSLSSSAFWESDAGWRPCVLVELGEVF